MAKQKPQRVSMGEITVIGSAFHPDFGRSSGDSPARKALREFHHAASFFENNRVIYIPHHAQGDRNHKDCESGVVSSNRHDQIFVKFDTDVAKFGFEGATAKSCNPQDLVHEKE